MDSKPILLLSTLLLLMAGIAGCEECLVCETCKQCETCKECEKCKECEPCKTCNDYCLPTDSSFSALLDTWKLIGFGNVGDGSHRQLQSDSSKSCTLSFFSGGGLVGFSSTNECFGSYEACDERIYIKEFGETKINEITDEGRAYIAILQGVAHRYKIDSEQLKLYSNDGKRFLLFARRPTSPIPVELLGTWKLVGFGNTADSTLRTVRPENCGKCYTLVFNDNGTLGGVTSINKIHGYYNVHHDRLNLIRFGIETFVGEYEDGELFMTAVRSVTHFRLLSNPTRLELSYNGNKNYLLFKQQS